jgi:ubiquinone/menaquinone biosynthesis C-methylase UbiE
MSQQPIRFEDGTAYDRAMGVWSQLVGREFLDWLSPKPGWRWIDVGCGTGAFSELLIRHCAPAEVQGIDPSEAQLRFAQARQGAKQAVFQQGDAMALPFEADRFDAAVMALVIFFVPEPAKGVAEMARVVRPGGMIAAYAWDMPGGGFPFEPIHAELRALGVTMPRPPQVDASRPEIMRALWTGAGLERVETREFVVQRSFAGFDDFWNSSTTTGSIRPAIASMAAADVDQLKARLRARLPADASGRIAYSARANAVRGWKRA